MQTRMSSTPVPLLRTWKDGHVTTSQSAQDFDELHVAWQTAGRARPVNPAPTPFRFYRVRASALRGLALRNNQGSGYLSERGGYSSPLATAGEIFTPSVGDEPVAYAQALGKLADKIRPADMSIDLFQWRKTLETLKRLTHFVETTKKSYENIVRRQGPHKEFANLYLEFTYGIQPTAETLYAAYNLLMKKALAGNRLVHFRGRGRVLNYRSEKSNSTLFGYTNVSLPYDVHSEVRCQIDVWLKPELTRVRKLSQYTALDPASWAYALLPYSFVLDWFWNFGGFLRTLETALIFGQKFHSGTATYTWEKLTSVRDGKYVAADGESAISGLTGWHNYRLYDRRVLSSFPLPRIPQLTADFGWRRMLNAAALLAQFLPDLHKRAMKGSNRRIGKTRRTFHNVNVT